MANCQLTLVDFTLSCDPTLAQASSESQTKPVSCEERHPALKAESPCLQLQGPVQTANASGKCDGSTEAAHMALSHLFNGP